MKSVIPFTKELEFNTKVSEITSISLERDFSLQNDGIEGNLYVTGEYKSHEISVNVVPFSFKIPFSVALGKKVKEDSISLEISDFAYDMVGENKIKVHIELELDFENEEEQEEEEESKTDESESIIQMMEERKEEEDDEINEEERKIEEVQEELSESTLESEVEEKEKLEMKSEEEKVEERNEDTMQQETDVILGTQAKEEYMTYHIHIVKEGETLDTLCSMYHVTGSYLAEYNDISNISLGDKILVPLENE